MYGIKGINLVVSKYKYVRILVLLVGLIFSNTAHSGFAVFTTSESSLEGASARYFTSQAKDLLDIPSSEIDTVFDPYLMDFEDVLSNLAKSDLKGASHLIYLALPTSFSENELTFSFDGELVGLREIYSTIGRLQGDYLLIVEAEQWPSSQLQWPDMPNNITLLAAVSSSQLQGANYSSNPLPYASDLSILFFQELIRAESGQAVSAKILTTRLVRQFKENKLLYFYGGEGSNAILPSFVPERGSYYFAKLAAEMGAEARETEARDVKKAQLSREAEARDVKKAQLSREAEARNAKKAQLAREAEAREAKKAQLAREAEARDAKKAQLARDLQKREQKQGQNTAKAMPPATAPSPDSASEADLGDALALIEQMKVEAAEREKQIKEASEEIKKKRKNTTSFGF
jgi:hypothetical protein